MLRWRNVFLASAHIAAARLCTHLRDDAQRYWKKRNARGCYLMLKLPPPVWTLIFLVVAAALSLALGWPKVPGLPFPPLGIALVGDCLHPASMGRRPVPA